MFAWDTGNGVQLSCDHNKAFGAKTDKKMLVIVKTEPVGPFQKDMEACTNIISRIVFMEFTKPYLDSLHNISSVSLTLRFTSYPCDLLGKPGRAHGRPELLKFKLIGRINLNKLKRPNGMLTFIYFRRFSCPCSATH